MFLSKKYNSNVTFMGMTTNYIEPEMAIISKYWLKSLNTQVKIYQDAQYFPKYSLNRLGNPQKSNTNGYRRKTCGFKLLNYPYFGNGGHNATKISHNSWEIVSEGYQITKCSILSKIPYKGLEIHSLIQMVINPKHVLSNFQIGHISVLVARMVQK